MTTTDQARWNKRYREGAYADRPHPTALLARFAAQLAKGRALDVACGAGRNSLFLASLGFEVDAVDISDVAIARAQETVRAADLTANFSVGDLSANWDTTLPVGRQYDLIVIVRYINTPLVEDLCNRLAAGGFLICEQHLQSNSDVAGPRRSSYRLGPGSLAAALAPLDLRYYREGIVEDPDGRSVALAQAIATRGGIAELKYC